MPPKSRSHVSSTEDGSVVNNPSSAPPFNLLVTSSSGPPPLATLETISLHQLGNSPPRSPDPGCGPSETGHTPPPGSSPGHTPSIHTHDRDEPNQPTTSSPSPSRADAPVAQQETQSIEGARNSGIPQPQPQPLSGPQPSKGMSSLGGGAALNMDQQTAFWTIYNKAGDIEDKEFVKTSGGDLDVMLIFAGLFSATNTAFIIESYKNLKPDPVEETNKLLRSVLFAIHDPSSAVNVDAEQFAATSRDIRVNVCFFFSLCCSLSAAFGAVLSKQWLTQYDRDGGGALKSPSSSGRERHLKYEGRDGWYLEHIVATLPTLLQFSLFFFLIGLVDFIWPLNIGVTCIAIGFTFLTFLFYITTTSIAVKYPSSPFQTRLSAPLRAAWSYLGATFPELSFRIYETKVFWRESGKPYWWWPIIVLSKSFSILRVTLRRSRGTSAVVSGEGRERSLRWEVPKVEVMKPHVDERCILYVLERIARPEDLDAVADALDALPGESEVAILVMQALMTFHLKPGFALNLDLRGLYGPARRPLLKTLHTLVVKWRYCESRLATIYSIGLTITTPDFIGALPGGLLRAYLTDPGDEESAGYITTISYTLSQLLQGDPPSTYWHDPYMNGWVRDTATKHLENDEDEGVQQRTLTLLSVTGSYLREAWDIMTQGALKSQKARAMLRTMWANRSGTPAQLDNFWVSTLRIQVLSRTMGIRELQDMGFVQHFTIWSHEFRRGLLDWPSDSSCSLDESILLQREWAYWTYELTLAHLLGHEGTGLSAELVSRSHLDLLQSILRKISASGPPHAAPLGLYSFLWCWHHGVTNAQNLRLPDVYMTKEWLGTIDLILKRRDLDVTSMVSCMKSYGHIYFLGVGELDFREWVVEKMCCMLNWLLSYLQEAQREGLLDDSRAELALENYERWKATLMDYSEDIRARFRRPKNRLIRMMAQERIPTPAPAPPHWSACEVPYGS